MIAFVSGKRVTLDQAQRMVSVQGKRHLDQYPFAKACDRVTLYQGLAAKHANNPHKFYQSSLAAAQRAAEMVAQLEAGHESS